MDLLRATEFLAGMGFSAVAGVTFDFEFNQTDGLSGVALLHDGRQVRFWLPNDPVRHAVVNVMAREAKI